MANGEPNQLGGLAQAVAETLKYKGLRFALIFLVVSLPFIGAGLGLYYLASRTDDSKPGKQAST